MLTGFYTVASGMFMQQRMLDVSSNNMANDRTPGFKAERVVSTTFEQELLTRMEPGNTQAIGKGSPVRLVRDVPTAFDPGMMEDTGRPHDMAISGNGFFNILTEGGGQYLTRNGNFDVDEEGYLFLRGAGRVLGEGGEIQLENADFVVLNDGTIQDLEGRAVDKLLITAPNEGTQLKKFTNGLYMIDEKPLAPILPPLAAGEVAPEAPAAVEPGVTPVEFPNVKQRVLESSNIDWNAEMSLMMEIQRTFQSCSKALQIMDQANQKTVSIASL